MVSHDEARHVAERAKPTHIEKAPRSINVKKGAEDKHLSHHEYEFKDKEDLRRFFKPYFKNVVVFETIYPGRHNLYFWASDAEVPFSPSWNRVCSAWASETAKTLDA